MNVIDFWGEVIPKWQLQAWETCEKVTWLCGQENIIKILCNQQFDSLIIFWFFNFLLLCADIRNIWIYRLTCKHLRFYSVSSEKMIRGGLECKESLRRESVSPECLQFSFLFFFLIEHLIFAHFFLWWSPSHTECCLSAFPCRPELDLI